MSIKSGKVKIRKTITAIVHIYVGTNNIILTLTDMFGDTLASASAGSMGFKGSKKSTSFAAQQVGESLAAKARDIYGVKTVAIIISGPGNGRESAIRAFSAAGLIVIWIKDVTPLPHNGCRPPKKRRI